MKPPEVSRAPNDTFTEDEVDSPPNHVWLVDWHIRDLLGTIQSPGDVERGIVEYNRLRLGAYSPEYADCFYRAST